MTSTSLTAFNQSRGNVVKVSVVSRSKLDSEATITNGRDTEFGTNTDLEQEDKVLQ